ncbi:MAG TPA: O-antigen ligase family protein [Gaiellaceae bacterium]|nr:O-antigen ligase family protein [Gaiellaceae bacterium]
MLTAVFLVAWASERLAAADTGIDRTAATVLGFLAAFLLVYLAGWFNLDTQQALTQWGKGMVKAILHFLFVVAGVAYLARRSERSYWRALAAFMLGIAANAAYGVVQLAVARVGINLDDLVLRPLTRGASAINVYGAVEGQKVYRTNALTGDPNHLGIALVMPLLVLTPIYLRLERGHRLKVPLAVLLAFLLVVELSTLSRSGLLGLGVGFLVLAVPYRRLLVSRALLVPLTLVAALLAYVVYRNLSFFEVVLRSRTQTGNNSTSVHLAVYEFVPDVLATHPVFGFGLNTFSVYYEFVTGKTNFGPHSFYVALLVETGLVGAALFGVFLWYVFRRLAALRAIGRALTAAGDPAARRVRPLAWGLTAALAGTMAANLFYLTMIFYSFYAFLIVALAAVPVFARRLA